MLAYCWPDIASLGTARDAAQQAVCALRRYRV